MSGCWCWLSLCCCVNSRPHAVRQCWWSYLMFLPPAWRSSAQPGQKPPSPRWCMKRIDWQSTDEFDSVLWLSSFPLNKCPQNCKQPKTTLTFFFFCIFIFNKSPLLRFQQSKFSSKVKQNLQLPAAGYIRFFLIFYLDVPPVFWECRRRLRVQERSLWRGEEWAARLPLLGRLPGQRRLLHQLQDSVQRLATPRVHVP